MFSISGDTAADGPVLVSSSSLFVGFSLFAHVSLMLG